MKRLFRWLFRLLILLIVLLVALVLLKDTLLKELAVWRIRNETGLSVSISKLELGIFTPRFTMEGFKLYNPPEFGGTVFLDIPQVSFEYEPREAAAGRLRLVWLRFNLQELNLVRNKAGQTNIFGIAAKQGAKGARPSGSAASRRVEFGGIDHLYLSIGTLKYIDLLQPQNNWQRNLGWKDWEVKNLRTAEDVKNWATLVLLQVALASSPPSVRPGPAPATGAK